ncbi:MAG: hypothetical protein M0Z42_08035 [Actinomycetota bacterium]|jgi:hypothetical protein|nr:hypothetical protein [Actinomycetota bacterium]
MTAPAPVTRTIPGEKPIRTLAKARLVAMRAAETATIVTGATDTPVLIRGA